ncbi:MAG: PstS family phosphate ABC transporter substrate-binding protein [Alphaproteobacteria bacterium]
MRTFLRRIALWLLCFLWVQGSAKADEVIRVGGTGAGTVILQRMIEKYTETHPEVRFTALMPPLGSTGGFNALMAGAIHLAILSKKPDPAKSGGIAVIPWMTTPFVLVGRDIPDNSNLTRAQVAGILSGSLLQWPNGKPIRLVMRSEVESDTKLLASLSPAIGEAVSQALKRAGLTRADHDIENQQYLERTPGAFGTMSLVQMLMTSPDLKALSLDGVVPSLDNLRNGSYPHEKKFYLMLSPSAPATARDFVTFLQASKTREYLGEFGMTALEN